MNGDYTATISARPELDTPRFRMRITHATLSGMQSSSAGSRGTSFIPTAQKTRKQFLFADCRGIAGMQRELCVVVQRWEPSMSQPVPIQAEIVFHPSRDGPIPCGSVSPHHRNSPLLRGCRCHDRKHVSPARCQLTAAAARNPQVWPCAVRLRLNRTNTVVNAHPALVGHAEGGHQSTYRIVGCTMERNRKVPERLGCAVPANQRHSRQHQDGDRAPNPNPSDLRARHIKAGYRSGSGTADMPTEALDGYCLERFVNQLWFHISSAYCQPS